MHPVRECVRVRARVCVRERPKVKLELELLLYTDSLNPVAVVISSPRCITHSHTNTHAHS